MNHLRYLFLTGCLLSLVACGSGSSPEPTPRTPDIGRPQPLNSESQASASFIIENTGEASLDWTITVENDSANPTDEDWFTVTPQSGTLAAGGQDTVTLELKAGLEQGTYVSTLTVRYPGGTTPFEVSGVVGDTDTPSGRFSLSTDPDYSQPPALTVTPDSGGVVTVGIDRQNGFSGTVELSLLGAPEGVTGSFAPASVSGDSSTLTVTTSSAVATGDYELSVKGSSGDQSATTKVLLSVINGANPATFNLAVSPSNLSLSQGASGTATLTVRRSGGFSDAVSLSAPDLPSGVTVSFTPESTNDTASVRVRVGGSAAPGSYQLTLRGSGGGKTTSTKLGLTITASDSESARITGTVETDNYLGDFSVPGTQTGLLTDRSADGRPRYVANEVIVGYRSDLLEQRVAGNQPQVVLDLAQRYGLQLKEVPTGRSSLFTLPDGVSVPDMVARLRQDPGVAYAEPNYYVYAMSVPNDTEFDRQWHLAVAGVPVAWDARDSATSVPVAVVDSGFDLDHPDLSFANDGYDFCGSSSCVKDSDVSPDGPDDIHGTHLAGIVAAQGDNARGVAGVVKGGATLVPVKIFYDYGVNTYTTAQALANGIRWAAGLSVSGAPTNPNPAKIINLSVGTPDNSSTVRQAVEAAQTAGALVVAAAGNVNEPFDVYPAAYADVLSVGSVNSNFERACFSNTANVDLVAPGGDGLVAGVSACSSAPKEAVLSTIPGGYGTLAGTSQAAPLVAGVAALVWAQNRSMSASDVAQALLDSAYLPSGSSGYGAGVVRADVALGFPKIGSSVAVSASGPDSQVDTVTLRQDGASDAFDLGGLKAGTYTLEADVGRLSASTSVSVQEGQTKEVTLRLEP